MDEDELVGPFADERFNGDGNWPDDPVSGLDGPTDYDDEEEYDWDDDVEDEFDCLS